MSYVGQSIKRFEDPRLVTGKGAFWVISRFRTCCMPRACAASMRMLGSGRSRCLRLAPYLAWSLSSPERISWGCSRGSRPAPWLGRARWMCCRPLSILCWRTKKCAMSDSPLRS